MINKWFKITLLLLPLSSPTITLASNLPNMNTVPDNSDTLEQILDANQSIEKKLHYFLGEKSQSQNAMAPSIFLPFSIDPTQTIQLAARTLINSFSSASSKINNTIFNYLSTSPTTAACTADPSSLQTCMANSYTAKVSYYGMGIPLSFPYETSGDVRGFRFGQGQSTSNNNFLLSPETIFGKVQFTDLQNSISVTGGPNIENEEQAARVFSDYLVSAIPPKMPTSIKDANSDTVKKYSADLRSFTAYVALLKGNLEDMIALRKQQGAPANKSLLKIEQEMATKRIDKASTDPSSWYRKISQASPETVQREIAYMLAEMNYQLYLNRRMNEKLLATMTAIGAGSLAMRQPDADIGDSK